MDASGIEPELTSGFTTNAPKRLLQFIDVIKSLIICRLGLSFARVLLDHPNSIWNIPIESLDLVLNIVGGKLLTATTFK